MIKPAHLLLFLLAIACGESKDSEKPASPRIKKLTKLDSPTEKQQFVRGSAIPISFTIESDIQLDSVQITVDGVTSTFNQASFELNLPNQKVGSWKIRATSFYTGKSETHYRNVLILQEYEPEAMTYNVVNEYPHDTKDYTQGLLVHEGFLYESTGQRGESTLEKKNIETGETEAMINLDSELFGEGLAIYNNLLFQLTWTAGKALVYDLDLNPVNTLSYQTEGWGLATLGDQFVMTDGSEKLYFVDPSSFTSMREIEVYDHEGKISELNELEVIDGLIYANIYQENDVIVIDPETGEVLQRIDFSGLLSEEEQGKADVFNGIAVNPENGKIYVTGKWWPKLFEVTIEPKTLQ